MSDFKKFFGVPLSRRHKKKMIKRAIQWLLFLALVLLLLLADKL